MFRQFFGFLPRLALSIGLLALLAFVVAEPRAVADHIANLQAWAFGLAVALTALDRVMMAYKWRLLLESRGVPIDLWTTIRAYFATSLAGLFLPVTVGADAIRVLVVRRYGVHDVTASIVVERTIGMIAMGTVAMVSCAILASAFVNVRVGPLALVIAAVVVVGSAGFVQSIRYAERWANRRGPGSSQLARIAHAYAGYRSGPGTLAAFYALSVVESLIPVAIHYVVALGLGLAIPLSVFVAGIPLALTVARLPVSLGGFGVQEASFVYLAGLMGVPIADALSTMLVADAVLLLTLLPSAFDVSMMNLRRQAA